MIKVENISVMNIPNALRGMRNPLESWDKSDSTFQYVGFGSEERFIVGPNDMKLALKLVKAGSDHSKFMRQILVSMDITAPDYWYKEFDTYKVGTVANSTSTMHRLGSRYLREDDFSWDTVTRYKESTLDHLNILIEDWKAALEEGNKDEASELWRELIQDLPMSYNYLRTFTMNYAVLRNMYHSRKNHKLTEWREFCKIIESLPYSELITT